MNDTSKPYVFISYSHKNDISNYLSLMRELNFNAVFDDLMRYGENWLTMARKYIKAPECKGVILLLSVASSTSPAVLAELEITKLNMKPYFAILIENDSLAQISEYVNKYCCEEDIACFSEIMEYVPVSNIYLNHSEISNQKQKLSQRLAEMGVAHNDDTVDYVTHLYSSDIKGETERLDVQQQGYLAFDMTTITPVIESYKKDGLVILDLGCSNGSLTRTRFDSFGNVSDIIGVDYNPKDIEKAQNAGYGDKYSFIQADLDSPDAIDMIKSVMTEKGIKEVDIVYSSLTLHHLKNPDALLRNVFDLMSENGKIILRGSDDGGKLCYPGNELMHEIFERYAKLISTSDRFNGRKLYSQLSNAGFSDIKMTYFVTDTCGKTRRDKEFLFDVGFGFRYNRINKLMNDNPDDKQLRSECEWLLSSMDKFKESFFRPDFWYSVTTYAAIARAK